MSMDPAVVRAYLQTTCAALGFDIGEVWWVSPKQREAANAEAAHAAATNEPPMQPSTADETGDMKFVQLYTSKSYDVERKNLVQPLPGDDENRDENDQTEYGDDQGDDCERRENGVEGAAAALQHNHGTRGAGRSSTGVATTEVASTQPVQPTDTTGTSYGDLTRSQSGTNLADLAKHVLSPALVSAISASARVVWANCQDSNGLLGRSDMKLQTAVGLPVAMDSAGNMCIVLMFSPRHVESNMDAMEYLQAIFKFASGSMKALLPVLPVQGGEEGLSDSDSCSDSDSDDTADSSRNAMEGKMPAGATTHFLSLRRKGALRRSNSMPVLGGRTATTAEDSTSLSSSSSVSVTHVHALSTAPRDEFGIPMLPESSELQDGGSVGIAGAGKSLGGDGSSTNSGGTAETAGLDSENSSSLDGSQSPESKSDSSDVDEFAYNVWESVTMSTTGTSVSVLNQSALKIVDSTDLGTDLGTEEIQPSMLELPNTLQNSARPRESGFILEDTTRQRVEEFVRGFLGLSSFDAADVFFSHPQHRRLTQIFTQGSETAPTEFECFRQLDSPATLMPWEGAAGTAYATANPVWSSDRNLIYDKTRAQLFSSIGVNTVLSVPIIGGNDMLPKFVMCFYSRDVVECVPYALRFVQQAVKLIWSEVKFEGTVKDGVWRDVRLNDLGEIAANIEQQQLFTKKRTHEAAKGATSGLANLGLGGNSSSCARISSPRREGARGGPRTATHYSSTTFRADQFAKAQQARADIDYILDPYVPVAVPVEAPKLSGIGAALAAAPVPPPPPVPSVKVDDVGNDGIASPPQPPQHVNFSMSFEEDDYDLDGDRSRPIKRRNSGANLAGSFGSAGNFGSLGGFESYQHNSWDATYNYTPAPAPFSGGGGGNFESGNFGSSNGLSGLAGSLNNNMQTTTINENDAMDDYAMGYDDYDQDAYGNSFYGEDPPETLAPVGSMGMPMGMGQQGAVQPKVARGKKGGGGGAGNSKLCRILGCDDLSIARRPYCMRHSGSRQCEYSGPGVCGKCAQGSTRFCIAHGGGRRCTFVGCDKGARDKYFCAAHGGGKRCSIDGCTKSAVGGSSQCTSHGGGKRCQIIGCEKSAQSSTHFCVKHGGGKKCMFVTEQNKRCDRVARGRTDYCASHGGGVRCRLDGCNRVAIGKMQLCRSHGQQNKGGMLCSSVE